MREIKFRVWDKDTKTMHICGEDIHDEISFSNKDNRAYYYNLQNGEGSLDEDSAYILMQYTGLHDKNGKEIYEGDIVSGTKYPFIDEEKQNYIGIVVFYEDAAQFGYEYKCVNKDKKGISNGINNEFEANDNLICEDLEVIGNIYDNKNLLEGE